MVFDTKTILIIVGIFIILVVLIMYFVNNEKTKQKQSQKYKWCYDSENNTCYSNKTCTDGFTSQRDCEDDKQQFWCYDSKKNDCYSEDCKNSTITSKDICLEKRKYCFNSDDNLCYTENCTDGSSKTDCDNSLKNYCISKDNTCYTGSCTDGDVSLGKVPKNSCREQLKYYCYDSDANECQEKGKDVCNHTTQGSYPSKTECDARFKHCYSLDVDKNECNSGTCGDNFPYNSAEECATKQTKYCLTTSSGTPTCTTGCTSSDASTSPFVCINKLFGITVEGDFKIVKTNALITVAKLTLDVGGKGTISVGDADVKLLVASPVLEKLLKTNTLNTITNSGDYFKVIPPDSTRATGIDVTGSVTFELIKSA